MNKPSTSALPGQTLPRAVSGLLALVVSVSLMACASSVSLEEVPVTDRSSTPVTPLGQGSVNPQVQGGATPSGEISAVQVAPTGEVQPDQLARVVYFDYDSFVVKPEFTAMLEANARYLKADAQRRGEAPHRLPHWVSPKDPGKRWIK